MRAGVLTMGPLLGRYQNKKISIARSGGCSLGVRDINYHLSGFETLKAKNTLKKGYVLINSTNGLIGSSYRFPEISVTGTSNLIMAAVLAKGKQILKNISIEPEVIDLIHFLNKSGAKIKFLKQRSIEIEGVKKLIEGEHEIIGDRIEAFSYLCVGAITRGKILVKNINPAFLKTELRVLKNIGFKIKTFKNTIQLYSRKKLYPIKVRTGPFPNYTGTDDNNQRKEFYRRNNFFK